MRSEHAQNANRFAEDSELEELRAPLEAFFRRRTSSQDDVPDMVQDVFLRMTMRDNDVPIQNITGYAFQVASSVLIDRARRIKARNLASKVDGEVDEFPAQDPPPDRIVEGRRELAFAIAALQRLPERTRTVFVLRRIEGMPYREIAEMLGVSVSSLEKHMIRAVAHLTKHGRQA